MPVMSLGYIVVLLREKDGRISAIVPAVGVASWGHTVPEALKMVEEALRCHLASMREDGEPIPPETNTFSIDMGEASDGFIFRL
jgi:predicted RNase H-like HicB family nuclease